MAFLDHIIGLGIVISKQDLDKLINLAGPKDGKLIHWSKLADKSHVSHYSITDSFKHECIEQQIPLLVMCLTYLFVYTTYV